MTERKPSAAKRSKGAKKSLFKELPPPIRDAFAVAANELFVENIEDAVGDARQLLEEGALGVTYQGIHRGLVTPAQLAQALEHLGPWLTPEAFQEAFRRVDPKLAVGQFAGDLYDDLLLVAAVDLARGILAATVGEPLPGRVQPYKGAVDHLAARLTQAIENEDSSEQDLTDEILG